MHPHQALKRIVACWASSVPEVNRVWLFGSRAKGCAREDSDVDLAVEIDVTAIQEDDAQSYWMFEADDMRSSLQSLIPCRIDLQLYVPGTNDRIVLFVAEASIILYEKHSAAEVSPEAKP